MRRLLLSVFTIAFLTIGFQGSAYCANKWYAGFELGPEFVTSDEDNDLDTALAIGLFGGYHIDRKISLEANLTTASHDGPGGSDLDNTSLLFGPRITGQIDRNIFIYGDAGLGIYFQDYHNGHYYWHNDESDTNPGIYIGGGLEFPIQRPIKIGIDIKYHFPFGNHPVDTNFFTMLMRINFDL